MPATEPHSSNYLRKLEFLFMRWNYARIETHLQEVDK